MHRLVLLYLLFISTTAYTQPYFSHYGVNEGLSNNAIMCSLQDKDGFLWFGTRDGLNRFDGYSFKQYYSDTDSNNGLGSNFIHSLLMDRKKNLWIGTDQGIYIFNPFLEHFTPFPFETKGEILQLQEDATGNIWFISDNRLFCYFVETDKLVQQNSTDDHIISAFGFDKNWNVWIGCDGLVKRLNTDKVYRLPKQNTAPHWIETIYTDKQNTLWIGTSKHGIYSLQPSTGNIQHVIPAVNNTPLFVRDIYQADDNHLWIATESGAIIYDKSRGNYEVLKHEGDDDWSLSDNAVYTISGDHQGGLWIGTFFGGINYYHPQHNIFQKFFPRYAKSSIQGHAAREIIQDHYGQLWIGTEDNGLCLWDKSGDQFQSLTPLSGLSHTNVHGLALAGDSLLVGTFDRGMDVIDIRTHKIIRHFDTGNTGGTLSNNFIFHLYRTKAGRILLATSRGLCEFTPGTNRFTLLKEVPDYIFYTSIFEDNNGVIWLATWRNGLYRVDFEKGKTQLFQHDRNDPKSLNSNRVNRIYQDSDGYIWIATEHGLAQWTAEGIPIKRVTKKDGLPSNLILAMKEDRHHNLWISTTHGLVRMGLKKGNMHVFDREAGLLDLQFNYNSAYEDSDGLFYFGSSKGFISFHPDSLQKPALPQAKVPIYITGLRLFQRDLQVGQKKPTIDTAVTYLKKIRLAHDESTIAIDFAALNFVSSQSTAYMYMLEGFDKDWVTLKNSHTAHFTKIPPGHYRLRVKAVDANGETLSDEKSLNIVISPPLWASIPAYIFYLLLASSLIYFLISSYDRRIKEKNRQRLEAIKLHRERELYKTKMDFFARIAHDIKTPLTLIKAPLDRLLQQAHTEPKTERLLGRMHTNTEKLVNLTNQLLDFRKIESSEHNLHLQQVDVNLLLAEQLQEYQSVFSQRGILFNYVCKEPIKAYIDKEVVSKIIDNLLTNAIKYADKVIYVELDKATDADFFQFTIKNDGRLLSTYEMDSVFRPFYRASEHQKIEGSGLGLALAHSFAELHRGTLKYLENSENLNIFVLQIPIRGTYV